MDQEINQTRGIQIQKIKSAFETAGITLSTCQAEQFFQYYRLLVETNKVMNLTAITDFENVVLKHFLDSVLIYHFFDFKQNQSSELGSEKSGSGFDCFHSIIDVGTGAGFPGIPLKIVFPELHVVLLDSLNKRVGFLNTVIDKLELKDISAVHSRAEDAARDMKYRDSFDLCVSRAVANLSSLSEYCLPFVKPGGLFVSYKSSDIDLECENAKRAIHLLGGKMERVEKCVLPMSDIERSFVIIRKEKETSRKYPRKAGIPSKNPL
ncbi:MAG: 16S rRNA (guanine(527)-N(7))-methyltransferase RsmG [Clostridiales bacterium]|nr:16S rRNA (guanine(527)-N(7))-methyltransferase RsmG [Clostridiales bacterium]